MTHFFLPRTAKTTFLCILMVLPLSLQAQTYAQSIKAWDDGKLSWDDFTKKDNGSAGNSSMTYHWQNKLKVTKKGNLVTKRIVSYTAMERMLSWVKPDKMSASELEYNQLIFDLVELTRRKMQLELDTTHLHPDRLYAFYGRVCEDVIEELVRTSSDGKDAARMAEYRKNIDARLAETQEEAPPAVAYKKFGLGYHIGVGNETRLGEGRHRLGPVISFEIGTQANVGKVQMNLDLMLGGGKLRHDISHKGYLWENGKGYKNGNIMLTLGYDVFESGYLRLSPFVGVGVGFIDYTVGKDERGNINDEIAGLRFTAGLHADFIIRRHLNLFGMQGDRSYSDYGIRFKIYMARVQFQTPCAPYSINFGIDFTQFGRLLK